LKYIKFFLDAITTGTDNYLFFAFPEPGILVRVDATHNVHISLNPVNFEAVPRMEIFIGAHNNTRSIIRRNGSENVVDVATPGILSPSGWNRFRFN
jgi:hypothetical protein